jgi:Asp-tRNA(Asn)/Glu-tRNA(Gln) amidotransferase A subunit family amidase
MCGPGGPDGRGLPVGIQLNGPPGGSELLLRLLGLAERFRKAAGDIQGRRPAIEAAQAGASETAST